MFLKRKVGVTERPRSLSPSKAIAMAICPIIVHCSSLLRTIFASLARATECARVQNVRDFPQTKLDSEINVHFLLNELGDPHFLFYKFNDNNILNN